MAKGWCIIFYILPVFPSSSFISLGFFFFFFMKAFDFVKCFFLCVHWDDHIFSISTLYVTYYGDWFCILNQPCISEIYRWLWCIIIPLRCDVLFFIYVAKFNLLVLFWGFLDLYLYNTFAWSVHFLWYLDLVSE